MTTSVVLVGGGLANCLIALRLRALRPELPVTIVEGTGRLGGNHTWSFHGTDVPPGVFAWLRPLCTQSWPHHDVIFPARERRMAGSYHSLTSERLHEVVMAAVGDAVRLDARVASVAPGRVTLEGGGHLDADLVVDGRGAGPAAPAGMILRFQKFLGQLVRLARPHGLGGPVLMDATVSQAEGYRFVYLLPFTASDVLIEDTYYSDSDALEPAVLRQRIARYAAQRGWTVQALLREETGVLPIVLDCDLDAFWPAADGVPRSGLRAGLFHHTTGYSLPEAAALADDLARAPDLNSAAIAPWIRERVRRRWRGQRVFRLLNRLLFLAALPAERHRILQHFYRLPEPVIGRFYAGRLTARDTCRVLSGTPPVPIRRALRFVLPGSSHAPATADSAKGRA